jgi:hypothetical protein
LLVGLSIFEIAFPSGDSIVAYGNDIDPANIEVHEKSNNRYPGLNITEKVLLLSLHTAIAAAVQRVQYSEMVQAHFFGATIGFYR